MRSIAVWFFHPEPIKECLCPGQGVMGRLNLADKVLMQMTKLAYIASNLIIFFYPRGNQGLFFEMKGHGIIGTFSPLCLAGPTAESVSMI